MRFLAVLSRCIPVLLILPVVVVVVVVRVRRCWMGLKLQFSHHHRSRPCFWVVEDTVLKNTPMHSSFGPLPMVQKQRQRPSLISLIFSFWPS